MKNVMCCFCGNKLKYNVAIILQVIPQSTKNGAQNLYCHKNCLREKLDKTVPLHPDLLDD